MSANCVIFSPACDMTRISLSLLLVVSVFCLRMQIDTKKRGLSVNQQVQVGFWFQYGIHNHWELL